MCEDLELIDRVDNVDPAAFEDDFLKRDIPVIVTDGVGNWSAQEKFNVHFLAEVNFCALKHTGFFLVIC